MFTNIAGYEWLNMANEMGNSNVSSLRGMMLRHRHAYTLFHIFDGVSYDAEKEKTTVEAQENSCQTANHADDVHGENQIKQEGKVKDFHENVEGCSFDNPPGGGDPPVAKHTSDGKGWFSILLPNLTQLLMYVTKLFHSDRLSTDGVCSWK